MSNVVFTSLADVQPESVQWLWEGRIPFSKVTLLEGEPGSGKSTLALELAARISRGAPMPLMKTHLDPANVVIFSGDDDLADTVRPILDAAGADLKHIWAVNGEIEKEDVSQFKPALIILDPLSAYLCVACERSPVEVMRKIGQLASDTGAAVLVLHGIADDKKQEWNPDFYGTPRSVLLLSPVGHGGRRLAVVKSNLGNIPDTHPLVYYIDDEEGQSRIVNWSDGR